MKYRVEIERRWIECSYAETVIEAGSKAEALEAASKLTDWEVEFPDKNLEPETEYRVTAIKEDAA